MRLLFSRVEGLQGSWHLGAPGVPLGSMGDSQGRRRPLEPQEAKRGTPWPEGLVRAAVEISISF